MLWVLVSGSDQDGLQARRMDVGSVGLELVPRSRGGGDRAATDAARVRRDIVVMHDGHHVNPGADRRYAVEATRLLVPALRARGYRFDALCGTRGS